GGRACGDRTEPDGDGGAGDELAHECPLRVFVQAYVAAAAIGRRSVRASWLALLRAEIGPYSLRRPIAGGTGSVMHAIATRRGGSSDADRRCRSNRDRGIEKSCTRASGLRAFIGPGYTWYPNRGVDR